MEQIRPSPLRNRCAPDGSIKAVAARGTFMGNRGGRLHRSDRTLGAARWKSRAWICCILCFRDRHRGVMGEGYTELFFLDEATALAAGHRPCFECRRAAARAFAQGWGRAKGTAPPLAPEMDRVLHGERLGPRARLRLAEIPPGALFVAGNGFMLRTGTGARSWSFEGYGPEQTLAEADFPCLTPPSTLAVLRAGYAPRLHASAQSDRSGTTIEQIAPQIMEPERAT